MIVFVLVLNKLLPHELHHVQLKFHIFLRHTPNTQRVYIKAHLKYIQRMTIGGKGRKTTPTHTHPLFAIQPINESIKRISSLKRFMSPKEKGADQEIS